ncbi:MAG: hypothetical protein M1829_000170 [Trizodia sp. TS-e1964]|nr:MAG: hypothetical protein M1829_000170 [Trizodia sp. TS-e1964]
MPIRNPFKKLGLTTTIDPLLEETAPPTSRNGAEGAAAAPQVPDSKSSTSLSIKGGREEPNEYKMSVVNDNGVYLPPSPIEKKGFWHRSNTSTTSSSHRSMVSDNEPFPISRESFDSYRRSFDISARCPVQPDGTPPRQSLDSRTYRFPRSAIDKRTFDRQIPTTEEAFEDVGLNDDTKPKRRGLFARFGDSSEVSSPAESAPAASRHGFHITGRKRGQSGQGAELGKIDKSGATDSSQDTVTAAEANCET